MRNALTNPSELLWLSFVLESTMACSLLTTARKIGRLPTASWYPLLDLFT